MWPADEEGGMEERETESWGGGGGGGGVGGNAGIHKL